MYKNWYQKKKQEEEENKERKRKIDETMASWTAEDWHKFRTAEFDIVVEPNLEAEERMKREEEKTDQIIDGSFWNLENPDFDQLSDDELGKRGKVLLQQLKPFYRKDLIKPFQVDRIMINLNRELNEGLDYNQELYRFEPNGWYRQTELIIDGDGDDIWYKPKWDQAVENMRKAKERGLLKNYVPSIASKTGYINLRELYEEKVFSGLDYKELERCAKSNDALDQLFFLYVIKRAQRQDEIAAQLIYEMYEDAVLRKAEYWVKTIEKKRGLKFKQDGELGLDNIQQMARVFLNMLITGDDPEAIFEQIKKLDDPRNIETYFTRRLGSKLKILIKTFSDRLKEKAKEYTEFKKIEGFSEGLLNIALSRFDKNELEQLMRKIEAARSIARNPKKKRRTTYREFINTDRLDNRVKQLYSKYCEREDFLIDHKIKGYPSLDDEKFNEFTGDEKNELEKIIKDADGKASANEHDDWYSYREFLDKETFTENEKKMFEIYSNTEDFLYIEYYPRLGIIRLDMQTFSNPYSWFSAVNWFNDKRFIAAKNKNFTNWLLGGKQSGKKSSGALIDLMNNWIRSSYFMKDTKKGLFKEEYIETGFQKKIIKSGTGLSRKPEVIDEMVNQRIAEYSKEKIVKGRTLNVIEDCLRKKLKLNNLTYNEIADTYRISRRQVIRIWKQFEEWLNKKIE